MNPDEQIPAETPASQNSGYYPPTFQNFSDDLQPESSQTQTLLLNNNQQYQPPILFFGTQQAQPSDPNPTENPSDQDAMVLGPPSVEPGREEKIQEIDQRLGQGCSNAYLIWLYFHIFLSVLAGTPLCICLFVFLGSVMSDNTGWCAFGMALIWATWWIWSLRQSIVMKNAIRNKSLEGARRGYGEMIWFAVYYLPTFIVFILLDNLELNTSNRGVHLKMIITEYTIALTLFYIPSILINLFGATQVVDLLEMKEDLIAEVNTQDETDDTNLAEATNQEEYSV